MCADKTIYDPKPCKLTYLFGAEFFADDKELERLDKERSFRNYLKYLADGNTKAYSRARAGLSYGQVENRRTNNSEFRALEERALEEGCDCIEQEAIRRGRDGVDEDVYYKGEVVGTKINYSDTMLLAVLKSKKPEYRESRNVVTAEINTAVTHAPSIDASKYTEEQLLQLEELLQLGGAQ